MVCGFLPGGRAMMSMPHSRGSSSFSRRARRASEGVAEHLAGGLVDGLDEAQELVARTREVVGLRLIEGVALLQLLVFVDGQEVDGANAVEGGAELGQAGFERGIFGGLALGPLGAGFVAERAGLDTIVTQETLHEGLVAGAALGHGDLGLGLGLLGLLQGAARAGAGGLEALAQGVEFQTVGAGLLDLGLQGEGLLFHAVEGGDDAGVVALQTLDVRLAGGPGGLALGNGLAQLLETGLAVAPLGQGVLAALDEAGHAEARLAQTRASGVDLALEGGHTGGGLAGGGGQTLAFVGQAGQSLTRLLATGVLTAQVGLGFGQACGQFGAASLGGGGVALGGDKGALGLVGGALGLLEGPLGLAETRPQGLHTGLRLGDGVLLGLLGAEEFIGLGVEFLARQAARQGVCAIADRPQTTAFFIIERPIQRDTRALGGIPHGPSAQEARGKPLETGLDGHLRGKRARRGGAFLRHEHLDGFLGPTFGHRVQNPAGRLRRAHHPSVGPRRQHGLHGTAEFRRRVHGFSQRPQHIAGRSPGAGRDSRSRRASMAARSCRLLA